MAETRKWWQDYSRQRIDFEKALPKDTPFREKVLAAVDDTAVLIKTQQSAQGGVLAGHNYHLAYVRDQYGTSRCLLKLGIWKKPKKSWNFILIFLDVMGKSTTLRQ